MSKMQITSRSKSLILVSPSHLLNLEAAMPQASNKTTYQDTLAEIEKFIQTPEQSEHSFQTLAELLHNYQTEHNSAYGTFCSTLSTRTAGDWRTIPALTTDTFKHHYPPSSLLASEVKTRFMTSGTTGEIRGVHSFRSTELYELSILEAWEELNLPEPTQLFILTPPPSQTPHSSLAHMMETLREEYCPDAQYLIDQDIIDLHPLIEAVKNSQPITLLGTALAFLNLFEQLEDPLKLPAGSWAMETGGYKGSGRTLTKEALYAIFDTSLGLDEDAIWNEYSMTELSSQSYTRGIGAPHHSPHWMKIQVLDPETNQPVQTGEMGYLVIHDLANIDSIAALRTQDLAIYHDEHSFTLIGRDPSALPRGCSRSIDASLNNERQM